MCVCVCVCVCGVRACVLTPDALVQWWDGYVELLIRAGVAEKDSSDSSRCERRVMRDVLRLCP